MYLCSSGQGNFYAYVANTLERIYTRSVPTFAVMPRGTRYVLMINPDFVRKQPFKRIVAILEHEILHIVLNHAPRGWRMFNMCETPMDQAYWLLAKPIAVDAATNEILRHNHPMEVIAPKDGSFRMVLAEDHNLPNGGSYETYMAILLERLRNEHRDPWRIIDEAMRQLDEAIKEAGGFQPGSVFARMTEGASKRAHAADLSSAERALAQRLVGVLQEHLAEYTEDVTDPARPQHIENYGKHTIKMCADEYGKSRGKLPSGIAGLIEVFLQAPTVSWNSLLRSLTSKAKRSRPKRGMRTVSKVKAALRIFLKDKFPQIKQMPLVPGTTRDRKFEIWYIVDTSGSMAPQDLAAGLNDIKHIQGSGKDVTLHVLYVDAQVGKHYTIGPTDEIDYTLVGRGGTDFEVAFRYIKAHTDNPDLVVYATDGYAPPPSTKLPCPTIWLITATGKSDMHGVPGHTVLYMKPYPAGVTLAP